MKLVPKSRYIAFLAVAVLGLGSDLYTKWWAFESLGYEHRESDPLQWLWGADNFVLMTSFNHGALWGMGQGLGWLFASLSIVAALGVLYWLFVKGAAQSWWLTIALALIMSGTLGNLFDRLGLHGLVNGDGEVVYAVRDFLYIRVINWPIFNLADSYLVTGAIMLLIQSFLLEDDEAGPEQAAVAQQPPLATSTPHTSSAGSARVLNCHSQTRAFGGALHWLPPSGARLGLYRGLNAGNWM